MNDTKKKKKVMNCNNTFSEHSSKNSKAASILDTNDRSSINLINI